MSSEQRSLRFWLSAWLPVILGILVIAVESTLYFGAEYTSGPFRWIFQAIFGPVSDAHWGQIHFLIRKSGHFLGYGTLGLLWLRAWWMTLPRSRFLTSSALAILGTALISAGDEFHQTFLPDRTGSPWDVLLDCCGAILLQLLVYAFMRLFRRERLERTA
ncbi:MAG: VanZ family protein [Acidobacteriota bacterium]